MGISSPCHLNNVVYMSVAMSTGPTDPCDPSGAVISPTTDGLCIKINTVSLILKLDQSST